GKTGDRRVPFRLGSLGEHLLDRLQLVRGELRRRALRRGHQREHDPAVLDWRKLGTEQAEEDATETENDDPGEHYVRAVAQHSAQCGAISPGERLDPALDHVVDGRVTLLMPKE